MNENTLDQILRINDLCNSVAESIEYYLMHKDNKNLYQNILDAVQAVIDSPNLANSNIVASRDLLEVLDHAQNGADLSESMNTWHHEISDLLNKRLQEELMHEASLSKKQAELLFHYLTQAPFHMGSYFALLMAISSRSGFTCPESTYTHMKAGFSEWPELLSSSVHEGYVYKNEPQYLFETCPVCGGSGVPYYTSMSYFATDFFNPFIPVKLWMKCSGCATLYTREFPKEFLELSENSRSIMPQPSIDKYLPVNGLELSIWSDVLDQVAKYTKKKKLLEVGIGQGALLAVALEKEYEVHGIELIENSAKVVADALDIRIWNGDFLKYNSKEQYSVITMGDVIEHIVDPVAALRKAYELLEEDGVLWLSTPNYESSFSRMRKFTDPMWMEPAHITYFSYRALRTLLEQQGFQVLEYKVSNRYNGSMELLVMKNNRGGKND